jgi:hypothetical protein
MQKGEAFTAPPLVMWFYCVRSVWQVVDGSLNPAETMSFGDAEVELDRLRDAGLFLDPILVIDPSRSLAGHVFIGYLAHPMVYVFYGSDQN